MPAPRRIPLSMSYAERRKEAFYTRAALKADPDATYLLFMTDGWLEGIDAAEKIEREADLAEVEADAARTVADRRLDQRVKAFGSDLLNDLRQQRPDDAKPQLQARFTGFFHVAPSSFSSLPQAEEAQRVGVWLKSTDPVLERHRAPLETWQARLAAALAQTAESTLPRGKSVLAREQHTEDFTRSRDALSRALDEIAEEKGYGRDYASAFFRIDKNDRTPKAPTQG